MRSLKRLLSLGLAVIGLGTSVIFNSQQISAAESQTTLTMDTSSYTMAPGNIYDFKAVVSGGDLKQSDVKVSDSRNGSVVKLTSLGNGKYRVTALHEGVTYVTAEIAGGHASIKVEVKKGVKQGGKAARSVTVINASNGKPVYGLGENVTISDSSGKELYSLSIDSVQAVNGRNPYSDKNPAQVVAIQYTYSNINSNESVYLYEGHFNVVDKNGFIGSSYPSFSDIGDEIDSFEYPKNLPKGTSCTATMLIGLNNKSENITIQLKDGTFADDIICTFAVEVD